MKNDKWPGFIPPQFPKLVKDIPTNQDGDWLHEMKFDGYRLQLHLRNGISQCFTRSGLDWSAIYPELMHAVKSLSVENIIIDGELVALDKWGHSNFQKLQNALKFQIKQSHVHLYYYAFDVLYLNGKDLRERPLLERKEILKKILTKAKAPLRYSDHFLQHGKQFYQLSCKKKLEGVVSKRTDSTYHSGRNTLWVKTKCTSRQEMVIGGYTNPAGSRAGFGALLMGVYSNGKLQYSGKVGTGFNQLSLLQIKEELGKLEQPHSPFAINSPREKNIHWLKPIKVAEISFANWTEDGRLRAPVFQGFREDKKAKEIHMEKAESKLTSPDKVLFKKEKITKEDIAHFYQEIAEDMLQYVSDRPLSLVRCPSGSDQACFYQKHIHGSTPEVFHTVPIKEKNGEGIYLTIDSKEGLNELVQMNAFELHEWNCHRETVMHPDQIVMDFDPGPGVPWKAVISAALELKKLLTHLKLKSFVKLTGSKGIHVHVPIAPLYTWDQVKDFAQALAKQMVDQNPKLYTANMAKDKRRGKIFIDYLRNGFGQTSVVPYSLRARSMSSVALPIDWKQLPEIKSSDQFSLKKTLKELKRRKIDPWKGMNQLKQKITVLE